MRRGGDAGASSSQHCHAWFLVKAQWLRLAHVIPRDLGLEPRWDLAAWEPCRETGSCRRSCFCDLIFHRIVWVGRDLQRPASPTPCHGRDISNQTSLLTTPSDLTLNVPRDGASPTSLGNLRQGFTTLRVKNVFP